MAVLAGVGVLLLCGQPSVLDGVLDGIQPAAASTAVVILAVTVNQVLLTAQHNLACSANNHGWHPIGLTAGRPADGGIMYVHFI